LPTQEDIFALVALHSDGYLSFQKPEEEESEKAVRAKRFFQICTKLPVELQMILAKRVYLSPQDIFLSYQTEAALKRTLTHLLFNELQLPSAQPTDKPSTSEPYPEASTTHLKPTFLGFVKWILIFVFLLAYIPTTDPGPWDSLFFPLLSLILFFSLILLEKL